MDKNSIIDKATFEVCTHAEDHPKVFVCDKPIAPVIALLNKKGYKTVASCSGHYKIEFYEYLNEDIKYLDEYKSDDRLTLDYTINYYDESHNHKSISMVMREIDNKCKLLEKWANNLPYKEREK